jgi:hypothetical protein
LIEIGAADPEHDLGVDAAAEHVDRRHQVAQIERRVLRQDFPADLFHDLELVHLAFVDVL